jgi:hypothetical protein
MTALSQLASSLGRELERRTTNVSYGVRSSVAEPLTSAALPIK